MEESSHWEALKTGSKEALEALYNHHIDALYAYGMALCQHEEKVKDCIQDLFLTCWNNRAGLAVPTSGKAYLMVSLRRRIFDKGPKSNLETAPFDDNQLSEMIGDDPEQQWLEEENQVLQQEKLMTAMASISDRQREILHMRYYQEMEYDQIAEIMGLNYQSARNLVTRALTAMRKAMLIGFLILMM